MFNIKSYLDSEIKRNRFIAQIHFGIANGAQQLIKDGEYQYGVEIDVTCSRSFGVSEIKEIVKNCGCEFIKVDKSKNKIYDQQYVQIKYYPVKIDEQKEFLTEILTFWLNEFVASG